MKRLSKYLREMAAVNVEDLDPEFMKRALRVTSFNLSPSDFITDRYKAEIQHLFNIHFFPKFDLKDTIKGKPSASKMNTLIKKLRDSNKNNFLALHNYNLKGVGPGEATLYFLLDDATLGGGSASAADINIKGQAYEVKAGDLGGDGFFKNFKLGGTVPMDKMVGAGLAIRDSDQNIKNMGNEVNGVNASQIKAIMRNPKLKREWATKVETPYVKAAFNYLNKNPLILMINKTPAARRGEVLFVGSLKQSQVHLDVITQGTIKPKLQF
jgi:hypothetical protein